MSLYILRPCDLIPNRVLTKYHWTYKNQIIKYCSDKLHMKLQELDGDDYTTQHNTYCISHDFTYVSMHFLYNWKINISVKQETITVYNTEIFTSAIPLDTKLNI